MCGIVQIARFDNKAAARMIWKRYQNQKTRGQEGYGFCAVVDGKLTEHYRSMTDKEIEKELRNQTATTILFHHRAPTSTPNLPEAAHPIKVSNAELDYDYYVVHNGVITNCDTLKDIHEALGYVYNTEVMTKYQTSRATYDSPYLEFNDSEALAIEVARLADGKKPTIDTTGAAAFIAYQVNKVTNELECIIFGRNYNPLKMTFNDSFLILASEGTGEDITAHRLYMFDPKTNKLTSIDCHIGKPYETIPVSHGTPNQMGFNTRDRYRDAEYYDSDPTEAEVINKYQVPTYDTATEVILWNDKNGWEVRPRTIASAQEQAAFEGKEFSAIETRDLLEEKIYFLGEDLEEAQDELTKAQASNDEGMIDLWGAEVELIQMDIDRHEKNLAAFDFYEAEIYEAEIEAERADQNAKPLELPEAKKENETA